MAVIKERFSHAKDILATLVGIFGTVLGFYYASQNTSAMALTAEFRVQERQLIGHIYGANQPYSYTLNFPSLNTKTAEKVVKDGWLLESIPAELKASNLIEVVITDAKGQKITQSITYEPKPSSAPAAAGVNEPVEETPVNQ